MKRPRAPVPTRDRILDEVEQLIAIKGVYGFKLRDVADRLDLKVPAIYKHYQSRDDVLVEVSRRFVSLLGAQFESSGTRRPVAALRRVAAGRPDALGRLPHALSDRRPSTAGDDPRRGQPERHLRQ